MPNENTMKKTFTDNLNRLLQERGITQTELAAYMEVSNTTISNWVKGYKVPRMDKVDKLCSFFKIKRSELLEQPPASDDLPDVSPTGQKIDARTRRQLEKVLEDDNLTYNGVVLNEEDREKVKKALELAFWDIKELNKRKKD
ncbi:helix-turn-helix transcriptional regulator [uncultured Selenomonas sp.]|uniref:helix-turn-helix domain-containing protein n=1 Tax=uncultured Selenomonas sp. TaxID=159275 RepID=UPI0028EB9AE1|nr:helix-turn-helix transcriptional regulator [uncultured Selenomonas sp.]